MLGKCTGLPRRRRRSRRNTRPGRVAQKRYYASAGDFAAGTETAAQRVTYAYDGLGRRTGVTGPDGTRTYAFDADGRVTTITGPEGTVGYEYDAATGRLTRAYTNTSAAPHQDVRYGYDAVGRLQTVAVHRLRNAAPSGGPLTSTYTYDHAGRVRAVATPGLMTQTYTYDERGRVLTAGGTINNFTVAFAYTRRADGRAAAAVSGTNETTYTYDALGRLVGEAQDWDGDGLLDGTGADTDYAVTYTLDLVGNRVTKATDKPGTAADQTVAYAYNDKDWLLTESAAIGGAAAVTPTARVETEPLHPRSLPRCLGKIGSIKAHNSSGNQQRADGVLHDGR